MYASDSDCNMASQSSDDAWATNKLDYEFGLPRLTRSRPRAGNSFAGLLALALSACSTTVATPAPTSAPVLGIDWGRAPAVERPSNYEETVAPSYQAAHPILRIQGQAMMVDLAALPSGGFVAVGYVPPDWVPYSWTSPDGQSWAIHQIDSAPFTFPVSLAVRRGGAIVAG